MLEKIISLQQNSKSQLNSLLTDITSKKNVSIFDANLGAKTWILSNTKNFIIYVVESIDLQNKLKNQFESFNKKVEILSTMDYDIKASFYKDDESIKKYISVLAKVISGQIDVLIVSPKILLQRLPNLDIFKKHILKLEKGKEYSFKNIVNFLVASNYKKVDMVEKQGEFSVRGDIIDIYSQSENLPFRIDFFGDEIDSISTFNTQFYSKVKDYNKVQIIPNTLCFIDNNSHLIQELEDESKKIQNKISVDDKLRLRTNIEQIQFKIQSYSVNGIENFLIPFLDYNQTIFDYLPKNSICAFDDVKLIVDSLEKSYTEFNDDYSLLVKTGDAFLIHKNLLIEKAKLFNNELQKISFQSINTSNRIFNPQSVFTLRLSSSSNFYGKYDLLLDEVNYYQEFGYIILIYAKNEQTAIYLKDYLQSKKLTVNLISTEDQLDSKKINIVAKKVCSGVIFVDGKIAIIGTNELLGKEQEIKLTKKTKRDVFTLPKIGDYVVHEKYGIGKCIGIERRKFASFEKDYIMLEYANGDKLYVPTEQVDLISSYVSTSKMQKLSKLGTNEFEKVKQKVKSSVKEMAFSLLELYAKREQLKGFKYQKDDIQTKEFENAFQFSETPDQLEAINAVKDDMESGKLMDRLVCGDVGYGKTEVALRAIFKAVQSGKQVAFLAPTTILAEQHFNTCYARMNNFMVNVAVLNRFKTTSQVKQILKDLKDGKIDVIVGTHRLLSKDVQFKDLGLLVLDEEQRFGVQDKEKIKNKKNNVDVLTLSATPIPRTLHMSLSGIRDISLITTAPEGRLPVQTIVTEYSDALLNQAIQKELDRDGQVIVVYNSIEHIYSLAENIQKMVGEDVKIGVAHGQMDEKTLENQIYALYNGQIRILVSTTLIENGINLPNANTLFVKNADRLGLSQLYQLRGRVGRATRLGYAYFTYDKDKVMTEEAYKRLNALMEFTELGSGFKIAMRDMEIRGCGNIMGKEQHGHLDKVGYDMYCKLLNQAIKEIRGEKMEAEKDAKIDVTINAFIPKDYIEDSDARFRVYNLLIAIKSEEDRQSVIKQIKDVYGKNMPQEVDNLSKISLARHYCQKLGISRLQINSNKCLLEFYEKQSLLNDNITKSLASCGLDYVLNFDNLPIILFTENDKQIGAKFQNVIDFLELCLQKK